MGVTKGMAEAVGSLRRWRSGPAGVLCLALTACGGAAGGLQKISEGALEVVGMKKDPSAQAKETNLPKSLPVKIVAGNTVNADSKGRGISVLLKFYQLRDAQAFAQLPYEDFGSGERDAATLGQSLVSAKELVLSPGRQYSQNESISGETRYLGVIAQFRSPAPERWRFVFPIDKNLKTGLLMGVHECAMTVSQGVLHEAAVPDPASLNAVRCTR